MKRTCLFLILLFLAACRTPQTLQTDTVREVRIVERDTLITIAPDSATIRALLDCDSTNQVILRRLETRNGTRIAASATLLSPSFEGGARGGLLSIICHEDSLSRELGGNQRLFIFGTAASMTMAEALTATEANGVSKLLRDGRGDINLIAIARKPQTGYQPGTAFLDSDVPVAVTACKTIGEAMQTANTPVRFIIEGRVANAGKTNDYKPQDATNGYACVLLGGTSPDGSAAVSVLLARACKYGSHIKVGNGQNGVLSVQQVYIGADKYEDRVDMETLHDAGFLTATA